MGSKQRFIKNRAAAWTPIQLFTIKLWLDGADDNTIGFNGSDVAQWDDKSGNGNDAPQGVVLQQPLYISAGLNGKNVVGFDGKASGAQNLLSSISIAQPYTIYLVGQSNQNSGANDYFTDGGAVTKRGAIAFRLAGVVDFLGIHAGSTVSADYTISHSHGTPHLFTAVFNGASSSLEIDGAPFASGNVSTQDLTSGLKLGSNFAANFGLDGFIAECIVTEGIPSNLEKAQVKLYADNRWGL